MKTILKMVNKNILNIRLRKLKSLSYYYVYLIFYQPVTIENVILNLKKLKQNFIIP